MKLTSDSLRTIRRALDIPQGKLAKDVGVHPSFISLIEAGYREIPEGKVQAIRDALPISDAEIETLLSLKCRTKSK